MHPYWTSFTILGTFSFSREKLRWSWITDLKFVTTVATVGRVKFSRKQHISSLDLRSNMKIANLLRKFTLPFLPKLLIFYIFIQFHQNMDQNIIFGEIE